MASLFAHSAAALALGVVFRRPASDGPTPARWWLLMVGCSVIPDADVLAFAYGIPYEHVLGHRGLSHSLAAALAIGLLATKLMPRALWPAHRARLAWGLVLVTMSHGLLDAMTTGGLGVAFFAPFDSSRYFLTWRPILVSPIGLSRFLSARGLEILANEALWVGVPSLLLAATAEIVRRVRRRDAQA